MRYPLSERYTIPAVQRRIMGPNPLKLQEELLRDHLLPRGGRVLDLGSGQGVTSLMLARDYGFWTFAADLWSDPGDNMAFFETMGLTPREVLPLRADAKALPFPRDFFDGVVSTDSYNYFGRDPAYLGEKLLPFVKPGGLLYIAVPGMKRDCHDALPEALRLSWTPEQLDYLHDASWWERLLRQTPEAEILCVEEMESNENVWRDWLACDNDYARGDRRAMEAGGGAYLNFVRFVLRKQ